MTIDTFSQAFLLDDENAATNVSRGTRAMQSIADATGATVLGTHHFGHTAKRMRGSTAFRANVDSVLEARGDGELFLEKVRDAPEVRLGWYGMPVVHVGQRADGRAVTSRHIREDVARDARNGQGGGFTAVAVAASVSPNFDVAFSGTAGSAGDGRLAAPTEAVRATFTAQHRGNPTAKRKAWERALNKASAAGFKITDELISAPLSVTAWHVTPCDMSHPRTA